MGKLQKNTNLVYDAIETSRLEKSINRPNENDGIIVVRIKTIKQFDNMVQDLREIEGTVGKALHIYETPANLPKFKDQIISLEYVNDCKGVKVEGATYNMKRFLTMQVITHVDGRSTASRSSVPRRRSTGPRSSAPAPAPAV